MAMENEWFLKEIEDIDNVISDDSDDASVHVLPGPFYQEHEKKKALLTLPLNELEGIYHLTESHTPGLRFKASLQYEKALNATNNTPRTIQKDRVEFSCAGTDIENQMGTMLNRVQEMPKEWTIVQLTSQFNEEEALQIKSHSYTNPIHISVFNCGKTNTTPFCVTVNAPFDKISNKTIEVCNEMKNIVEENKLLVRNVHVTKEGLFRNFKDKKAYQDARDILNYRLKNVVKEIQFNWLKEFRCLFIGKLYDETIETNIAHAIDQFFVDCSSADMIAVSEKQKAIIQCLVKGSMYLKLNEKKRVIERLFSNINKEIQIKIVKFTQDLNDRLKLHEMKRHSLLLIVDEKLDFLPWELIDVLENHPVTRMPCLHFTYGLFKEHEDSIEDGLKIIKNPYSCAYIVNPDSDLKQMEIRMESFFKYYLPHWKHLIGVKPTAEQFEKFLTENDIFSYHGHGNGAQFLSGDKIQKIRVKAVTLLFGCSSVMLETLGPKIEMLGQHYTYLIACSPCVVGMLWTVTDVDTDTVTTSFLSQWIKSEAPHHWKYINKIAWQTEAGAIKPIDQKQTIKDKYLNEPELLRALCKAKKEARHYITTAACVSRGLPVKIKY